MRHYFISLLILFNFLLLSCQSGLDKSIKWNPDMANTLGELKAGFKNPPIDFSTAPFWVWNDLITEEKIDIQLQEFKDNGMHMVFIHPRPGLITEYLGNEWFELVKYSVEKAREIDMKIWLYDENSFPSGFAGGHVPAATFSTSDPIAGLELHRLDVLSESDTNDYFLVIKQMGNTFVNITNSKSKYFGQSGKYYGFTKWYYPTGEAWFGGFSYVDLLAYGITEKFINLTMDGYEDYIGEEFGKLVPGIFTDEPNINTRGGNRNVIRFTPVLFNRFEKKYGYQLETYLPCLYDEIGDWKNVRHDYYALLLEMFLERWGKPWNEYTEENNLKWTGHYWEHGWPDPKHGGDNMAMYAYHQYPGIDMLFNTEQRPDQFGNIRAVKELSSVVNQLDKPRALSETYGGAGWELTFDDMKRLGDWEYTLGVNFMNQHLAYMTVKGARKRDFPQSMSYHAPWWDNYKPLNEYFHRLSFALTAGKQINRILILEPTSTAWMLHSQIIQTAAGSARRPTEDLKDQFHSLLAKMEEYQVEYDLGCESIIKRHGSVQGNQYVIGSRAYDLIVMPPMMENLMDSTFVLLEEYMKNGGKVLSFGGFPERLDGNKFKKMSGTLTKYASQWTVADKPDQSIIDQFFKQEDFIPADPESWGGNVFHQRRQLKDGQLYFFTNFHESEMAQIDFSAMGKTVLEFDPMTGDIYEFDTDQKEGMVQIKFGLHPAGSLLLFVAEGSESASIKKAGFQPGKASIKASVTQVKRLQSNTLTLDYCDLKVGGKTYESIYFYNAADTIYKTYLKEVYGFNYNPWSVAVQYRSRILDKNEELEGADGFEVSFPFQVADDGLPLAIQAVVEWPQFYDVSINGQKLEPLLGRWWLDKSFGVFDLSKHVTAGVNMLTLNCSQMDVLAEVEPVYLKGDFGVQATDEGWLIIKSEQLSLGSWKDQRMPFFSHDVSYSKTFEKPSSEKAYVRLGEWSGTVAAVSVNDKKAGILFHEPYELEITDLLQDGENKVDIVITGSLKNQLGPHHNNPTLGLVTPWSFFFAPQHQPPGASYDLLDYGLFEDFDVLVQ
jgi:hypothetical protein